MVSGLVRGTSSTPSSTRDKVGEGVAIFMDFRRTGEFELEEPGPWVFVRKAKDRIVSAQDRFGLTMKDGMPVGLKHWRIQTHKIVGLYFGL